MGKNPASQLYWNDLSRDIKPLSLEAKGAWLEIMADLHFAADRGVKTLDLTGWMGVIGGSVDFLKIRKIIKELIDKKICDYNVVLPCGKRVKNPVNNLLISCDVTGCDVFCVTFTVTKMSQKRHCNGMLEITCRRMVKEEKKKKKTRFSSTYRTRKWRDKQKKKDV